MNISKDQVLNLRTLIFKMTGTKLSFEATKKVGSEFLDSLQPIYKPVTKEDHDKQQKLL